MKSTYHSPLFNINIIATILMHLWRDLYDAKFFAYKYLYHHHHLPGLFPTMMGLASSIAN